MVSLRLSTWKITTPLVLLLVLLSSAVSAKGKFGLGAAYYNDYLHYNDKTYHDSFSWDLGLYSDFDNKHLFYIDAHLYRPVADVSGSGIFLYAGVGGIFVQDKDNYVHKNSRQEYEKNWGARFPLGVELISPSGMALFIEAVPTYIVRPDKHYETELLAGMRYYFD